MIGCERVQSLDKLAFDGGSGACGSIGVEGRGAQGSGHGSPEKLTGPPRPASASSRLMMTAMEASPLPSSVRGGGSDGEGARRAPCACALGGELFRAENALDSAPGMFSTRDDCNDKTQHQLCPSSQKAPR